MKKGSSSMKELEDKVIVASYRARQVEEDMIVSKHKTGELEEQVGQLKEQMHKTGELEEQFVQLKEQMHSMQQDFNKKHDDLLARLDSLSALMPAPSQQQQQQPEMSIDVVMTDRYNRAEYMRHKLNVDSSDTVDVLMLKIHQITGEPPNLHRIFYAGDPLDRCKSLSDHEIQSGSVIYFRL